MAQVCRLIESEHDERTTLARLGQAVGLSPYHLQRVFKRYLGVTPRQYAEALRMKGFRQTVRAGASITEALYQAGYGSSSRLYERAADELGMTPGAYRSGAASRTIRYSISDCPLGLLLVAATDKGVCAVAMGDNREQLISGLREEFPAAVLQPDPERLRAGVKALLDYMRGSAPNPELPLDVQGTAFQRQVWNELRRIPLGQTISYQELAARLGRPTGARAVAGACARNSVAMLIPCHRVVRNGGALAGYRWGLARKRELLARERAAAKAGKAEAVSR